MMSVCIYFTVTFFVEINQQYFFDNHVQKMGCPEIPTWY
jgi:hypothetical protein